jgi:protein involved in polysaccharide export with SLBB domain
VAHAGSGLRTARQAVFDFSRRDIGEVEHPGSFPYTSGLNVLSALAIAGGPTYRASKSTIMIQHPGESGLKEYAMDAAVPILPGDIVKVPQRYF